MPSEDRADLSAGVAQRENWKPRPGNYYFSPGSWVCDPRDVGPDYGVIAKITDCHESGTVVLYWFPNQTQYLSVRSFRHKLREGEIRIDDRQHPHDKTEWSA